MIRLANPVLLTAAALALAGCAESRLRLSPDFGEAVHQNVAAQTADPDAHYGGVPAPASDGARAAASQSRYTHDQVIPPASTSASTIQSGGAAGAPPPATPSP